MKVGFNIFILVCFGILISNAFTAQKDYTDLVKMLKNKIQQPLFKGASYERLAYITDTFGPRLWGSEELQTVINQVKNMAIKQGFQNIRLEPVTNFTKWVRGHQSLTLYQPRSTPTKLGLIGMGGSVSGNIKAQVIVLKDYKQLVLVKDKVKGKIVCYNNEWTTYGQTVQYRLRGGIQAAKYGAVGTLIRSVAPDGVYSVHTGSTRYDNNVTKIPIAAITIQDAEMFKRMQDRGQKIVVHFILQNKQVTGANSSNLVFQIKGATKPNQIILAGGHIDSWDTGSQTGANDDGGGFITVFQAMRLLLKNGLRPQRTIRFIAWSGQQFGNPRNGARQYQERHNGQLGNHIAAFESDLGSTKLTGFGHTGQGEDVIKMILKNYLSILDAGKYDPDGQSVDVRPLMENNIPVIKNLIQDTPDHKFYFTYHHTAGDSISIMNPDQMDSNVVGIASLLYILADLNNSLRQPKVLIAKQ